MSDVGLRISAELDMSKAQAALDNLKSEKPIKITADAQDALADIKAVQKGLASIKDTKVKITTDTGSGNNSGSKAGGVTGQLVGNTKQGLKEYNTLLSDIKAAESKALKSTDPAMAKFYKEQASEMRGALGQVYMDGIADMTPAQRASLQKSIDVNQAKIASMQSEAQAKAQVAMRKEAGNLYDKFDTGVYNVEYEKLLRQSKAMQKAIYPDNMPEYANKYKQTYLDNMNELAGARANMINSRRSGDDLAMIESANRYNDVLKKTKMSYQGFQDTKKAFIDSERFDIDKNIKSLNIDAYMKNNSRALKDFGGDLLKVQEGIRNSADSAELGMYTDQFSLLQKTISASGKNGLTFFDTLKKKTGELGTYMLGMFGPTAVIGGITSMYKNISGIDAAMTDLKKVTNETSGVYTNFLGTANVEAKSIGASIAGYVQSTADFARLGYGLPDAQKLARASLIYNKVGDDVRDIGQASQHVLSITKAFGFGAKDAGNVIDVLNQVGEINIADIA